MLEPARSTRFHCASSPPPNLAAVCKRIARSLRDGYLRDVRTVREIAAKADSSYAERGPADDLQRFLRNEGVLIEDEEDDSKLYFDAERATVVIAACDDDHTRPPPTPDRDARLAKLKSEAAHPLKGPRLVDLAAEEPDPASEPGSVPASEDSPGNPAAIAAETPSADQGSSASLPPPPDEELWEIRAYSDDDLSIMSTAELQDIISESERQQAILNQLILRARAEQTRRIKKRVAEIEEEHQHITEVLEALEKERQALLDKLPKQRP